MIVLDASLMIARLLSEAHNGLDDDLYNLIDSDQIVVPSHWPVEISNALWINIRRGRTTVSAISGIQELLSRVGVSVRSPIPVSEIGGLTQFATAHNLTSYDATYVHLAHKEHAHLATLDRAMRAAAQGLDIPLIPS